MKEQSRDFIKNSASLPTAVSLGGIHYASADGLPKKDMPTLPLIEKDNLVKDAGMQLCLAYWASYGYEAHRGENVR